MMKGGVNDPIRDVVLLKKLIKKNPDCNIGGIPPDGCFVIDVDGKKGKKSYTSLSFETKTATSLTQRGFHKVFEGSVPKSEIGLLSGIDVISCDGKRYIVLPPSKRRDGKPYKWKKRNKVKALAKKEHKNLLDLYDANIVEVDFSKNTSKVVKGKRNDSIFKLSCMIQNAKLPQHLTYEFLLSYNNKFCKPPLKDDEIQSILHSSQKYKDNIPEPSQAIKCLADVEATEPRFLVDPYVVFGSVTILEGDPSCGKSTLLAELVACVSTGKEFCGIKPTYTGSVLFFAFEDDISSVFKKRAMFQGADQSKIHFVDHDDVDLSDIGFEFLEQALSERKYAVVIIDTLTSALGDKHDMNKGTHMAKVLNRLRRLAETYDTSIIAVRHFRKGGSDNALYAGSGSVAITGAARSVLMVKVSPEDEDLRFLAHSKSNGVERGKTLQFRIKETPNSRIGTLHWDGQSPLMAEELLTFNSDNEKDIDVAIKFLKDYLADDAISATALISQAEKRSISVRTLNRAKKHLNIISSGGPGSKWSLPK